MFFKLLVGSLFGLALTYSTFAIIFHTQLPPYLVLQKYYLSQQPDNESRDEFTRKLLTENNYFLHVRHASREHATDIRGFDYLEIFWGKNEFKQIKKFTCLDDEGIAQAHLMSIVFASIQRPLEIITSPSCRAQETAQITFGYIDQINAAHFYSSAVPASMKADFELKQIEFF